MVYKPPRISLQTQLDKKLFRFKPIKINQKKDCNDIVSINFGNSPTAEYYANVDQEYNEKKFYKQNLFI